MKTDKKLTLKQERFCQEYIIDYVAKDAVIRAGYTTNNACEMGYQLLQKTSVKKRIQELSRKTEEKTWLTKEYILNNINELLKRCMQQIPVAKYNPETRKSENTGEWKFEYAGAAKALEMLGKHMALFTENIQHSGNLNIRNIDPEKLAKLSNNELGKIKDILSKLES